MLRISGSEDVRWDAHSVIAPFESLRFAERNVHIVDFDAHHRIVPSESGRLRAYSVEDFTLLYASGAGPGISESVEVRDRAGIVRDGRDRYGLMMQLTGIRLLNQLGRSQRLAPGELAFFSTSEPYVFENEPWNDATEMFTLFLPRDFVDERLKDGKAACLRQGSSHLDALARAALRLFASDAWSFTKAEFYSSARAVADLAMLTLGAAPGEVDGRSVRSASLDRVKHIVRRRLGDPELTLEQIAGEAGMSLNYVHKLFRDEQRTFWGYLKAERLRLAREMLAKAHLSGRTITDISFSCGFSDSSYFSRAFRNAYGMTPREAIAPFGTA